MVYDPVRDIEVPSPAASVHPAEAWRHDASSTAYFDHKRINGNSSSPHVGPSGGMGGMVYHEGHPPHFHPHASGPSPSMPMARRSISGGLRGLLNDDDGDSRRGSAHTASSVDDDHRPSIHRILNDAGSAKGASNIPQSTSSSSVASEPPSSVSPQGRRRTIDHSAFLTPAPTYRSSRSPYPINTSVSPAVVPSPLPFHDPYTPHQDIAAQGGGPSRRYSHTTPGPSSIGSGMSGQRPMLPPDTIPRQDYYDYSRITPGAQMQGGPLRSPSVSVSPRSMQQNLPGSSSRPTSSAGTSHPFAFLPNTTSLDSPTVYNRRLSEDPHARVVSRAPSETASNAPMGGLGPDSRRTSIALRRSSYASTRTPPVSSPSPIRTPYDPQRISDPGSVLEPITHDEISRLRSLALTNNPLRRKRRQAPSWSATPGPATQSGNKSTPGENDQSYFPPQAESSDHVKGRKRRESVSSVGRASITPGASLASVPEQGEQHAKKPTAKRRAPAQDSEKSLKRPGPDENGHDAQRRKISDSHFVGNSTVANHYNSRPEVGVQSREFSPIIGLKKFNNWIKSVLIGKFATRFGGGAGAKVLDIGCGKGGDLNKWKQARIKLYVGLDIADMSIEQARDRYRSMPRAPFDAHFYAWDCYSQSISNILPQHLQGKDLYDNVSMQFCMHYAFESASKARMMMENVSRYLRNGGLFIGTIPDAEMLLAKLEAVPEDSPVLRFGNNCYFIEFVERHHKGIYGHAYRFYLEDAVDDVPEYLVNWDNFVSLASEYRLRLVYKKAFNEVLEEEQSSRDFGPLLGKMGVINQAGESAMDAEQWEAANLYMAFAFEKY